MTSFLFSVWHHCISLSKYPQRWSLPSSRSLTSHCIWGKFVLRIWKKHKENVWYKNHLLFRTSLASIQTVLPKRLLAIKQFFLFYSTVNLPKRCIVLQSSSLYFVCVIVLFQDVILKLWKLSLLTGNCYALWKNGIHCRLLFFFNYNFHCSKSIHH